MKTAIVGAGAIGSLFGGILSEAGAEVWLVDVRQGNVSAINGSGVSVERDGIVRTVRVNATTNADDVGGAELAMILVKAMDTQAAAETAASIIGSRGLVLSLQNGLGNAEIIARVVEAERVLAGTTSHGATLLEPGHVCHAGTGDTVVGAWSADGEAGARQVAEFLSSVGLSASFEERILDHLWDKLLVSVAVNAVTALTGVVNGRLLESASTRRLMDSAVEEAVEVARTAGVQVREDPMDHVLDVIRATAANRSSMGQDVDNKRQTEIGAINGAVVREAEKLGLDVPVNRTLTALVETLQANY